MNPACRTRTRQRHLPYLRCHIWLTLGLVATLLGPTNLHAQTCVSAPSGLVGWWRGEGDSTDSAGSNDGTLQGGVGFAAGEVGPAFNFNGVDGWIEIPDAPELNFSPTSPMSIELWAFPVISQTVAHFVGKRDSNCGAFFEYQMGFDPNAGLFFNGSGGGGVSTHKQLPLNTWTHLAATFDGSTFSFYTNGVLIATSVGTLGPANTDSLAIGTSGGCPFFQGLIDEVSLYNRALTTSEIQSIYLAQHAGKCAPPTAPSIIAQSTDQTVPAGATVSLTALSAGTFPLSYQWSVNGTNLADATNASLTLTNIQPSATGPYLVVVSNAVGEALSSPMQIDVFTPACVPPPSGLVAWWAGEGNANDNTGTNNGILQGTVTFDTGLVGEAFSFDGASGTVIVPDTNFLRFTDQLTIEAWINIRSTNADRDIVSKLGGAAGNNGYELLLSKNLLVGQFNSPGQNWPSSSVSYPISITLGTWNHVAFTYDQSAMNLYINGQLVATDPIGPVIINPSSSRLRIGSNENNQNYFDGQIDEATVYNRALTATEVQEIYLAYSFGKCGIPPSILTPPQSRTNFVGQNASFSVVAEGSNPFGYQWSFMGTNLAGATSSLLVVTNVQLANSGNYAVVVMNSAGFIVSSNASLGVVIPSCSQRPSNLVAWWAGEGNADDNIGVNNGSLINGANFLPGVVGQAFHLSGTHQYVKVPKTPSLDVGNQVTIDFWMNSDPSNAIGSAIEGLITSDFYFVEMDNTPGHVGINFSISTNSGGHFPSTSDLNGSGVIFPAGEWHHIAGTYDGTNMQMYLDGQPSGNPRPCSGSISPMLTNSFIAIGSEDGRTSCGNCIGTRYFKGLIDEVDIFNRALSANEILAIYDSYGTGKCPFPPAFVAQPESKTVGAGTNITFTAAAAGSNPLAYQWELNGADLAGATNSTLVLTNVQPSNDGAYSITVSNSLGSVTSSNALLKVQAVTILGNGQVLSNAQYTFGNSVTIQLQNVYTNGDVFYTLDGSTPSFASTAYNGPFVLTQNAIVQALGYDANFVQSSLSDRIAISIVPTYTLTATTAGGGAISLSPTNSPYLSNAMVNLTATPSNGWSFLQWAGDVSGANLTNSVLMNSNKSVQALFGTSLSATSSAGGSVLRSPSAALYPYGLSVQLSALPQTNNYFALWGNAASGNLNPLYFALTNPNPTVSALFVPLGSNQVSLVVVPVGHGKVSVAPQANVFTNGQSVTITATPETNQAFLGWSGDASGAQNPLMVSMGRSKTIYANFSKVYSFGFTPLTGLGLKAGFQLDLTGEIPLAYRFDASTDLTNWLPLVTLTNYAGTIQYKDSSATNFNLRFYRGVPLP